MTKRATVENTPTGPKLADFPDAEVVGGAVILNRQNMGTVKLDGTVEPSQLGQLYLNNQTAADTSPPEPQVITAVPDPVPVGVVDPSKMAPVQLEAKAAVRKRKQNEVVIDAMNSPTGEQEAALAEADAAEVAGPEIAPNYGSGGTDGPARRG
jgi:hypothetical protein